VSRLTGGKFANGAITGAFSRLLNDDAVRKTVKPKIRAIYEKGLERVKGAVEKFDVLEMFEGKIKDGTVVEFRVDNDMDAVMQVRPNEPSTVYVNIESIQHYKLHHIASAVGHELIHVSDLQIAIRSRKNIDENFRAQTEVNATNWQIQNAKYFGLKEYGSFMRGVLEYKFENCLVRPSMQGC